MRPSQLTRRQVLGGGAVLAGAAVAGNYGRFLIADELEEHVGKVLGISTPAAAKLLDGARSRLGDVEFEIKAAQFVGVTTFPGSEAPYRVRNKGIGELTAHMVGDSYENLMLVGLRDVVANPACAGLLRE